MEKEEAFLARVAVNHLFLSQFEALRASILSLRKRNPGLALAFLRTIVADGGRFDGVLWSGTCSSPSHLAWLAALEVLDFRNIASVWSFDPDLLRLKVELLLLVQLVISRVSDAEGVGGEAYVNVLNRVLDLGLRILRSYVMDDIGDDDEIPLIMDDELGSLWTVFLEHADVFDEICANIQRQTQWFETPDSSGLAISLRTEAKGSSNSSAKELEALSGMQKHVQLAHLDAFKKCLSSENMDEALLHLRFFHLDHGVEETEYKMAVEDLIGMAWPQIDSYGEAWLVSRNKMLMIFTEALSSDCLQLAQTVQVIQDELLSNEVEKHRASNAGSIPFPIQKYLITLSLENTANLDDKVPQSLAIKSCMRDMYHYARISGTHILECVIDAALSAVRREGLQEASDIISLFPLLQPLVAVLGWDLLSGKTTARRKLMQLMWTSKSQVLRLEEFPIYGKHSDEVSCVEYLCDLLCFYLDLAFFVACVNSGRPWSTKFSLLFSQKDQVGMLNSSEDFDPFVENFVLERLAVQTPMRVLFDVVPGIKFQDAIEIISMQPIASTSAAWKRLQDIGLMHMRYALESAVLALGVMERGLGEANEAQFHRAVCYLKDLRSHIEAVGSTPRKVFIISILISLLHMDEISVDSTNCPSSQYSSASCEQSNSSSSSEGGSKLVVTFIDLLLDILHQNLPELEQMVDNSVTAVARQALQWRVSNAKHFIEDWKWRLSVLQRLQPLSEHSWNWRQALTILRAAPSKLLNLCMQRAKYDIGEEAVQRFSLPPEDKAALELAEWVAGAFRRVSVEDAVSRVAEGTPNAVKELDVSSFRAQLGPLPAILLCIDAAATSAQSVDMCTFLLNQGRVMLSEIYPGSTPKIGSGYWDQLHEVAIISVTRRILQHLHDLLEQEEATIIQKMLIEEMVVSPSNEQTRQGQRHRALVILHQMIDDAHRGKRQFLSGKLHNLARAVADEDADNNYLRGEGFNSEKKASLNFEKGVVFGLGLKVPKPVSLNSSSAESSGELAGHDVKYPGKKLFGPLTSKPSTYLSSFIIYIATIGDVVDGIDTTHDFNFFSLIYEWPKDLITRLVFERGSIDAAGKVADIMCADFVHEVITACVPPVLPPKLGHGWACIPVIPPFSRMSSENKIPSTKGSPCSSFSTVPGNSLYSLQLNIVKHLGKLSPVRAVLACVFGSSILSSSAELSASSSSNDGLMQAPDAERLFYEFALDQSERFPTLNRWIQMQSNLHRVSESTMAKSDSDVSTTKPEVKNSVKRFRESESDTESEVGDLVGSGHASSTLGEFNAQGNLVSDSCQGSPRSDKVEIDHTVYISFDWENEGPYENAVERLINEGKLMDALALSDRCLRDGASDRLLQLLIEQDDENNPITGHPYGYGTRNFASNSWQYCIRLKDKQLAAKLALTFLHRWELDAAMDVLTMCNCHLPQSDPLKTEVMQMRQSLQRYNHILSADDHYSCWQEVEAECNEDPEGLALRLAGKGAVSAALEVAESASLSLDLRRELQGRQLVKLLTTDPLSGGGPAEASRFLSSLRDSDDALPVAIGAMQLLPDLRSKQLLVHFFLKRRVSNLSDAEVTRLNSWALGLRVLALLPLPSQQRCSALHEHPHLILEVLLMMKQLQSAALILKEFPSLRNDDLILSYAAKAIAVNMNSAPREPRISISASRPKQKTRSGMPSRSNFTQSIGNLQKEARRAFSWAPRDTGNKTAPKDAHRKRKSSGWMQSERGSWEAMSGIQEERISAYSADGQERLPFVSIAEEWVLTGDSNKDNAVRLSHRYETAPDITVFKALLSLCSDELTSAKGALQLCVSQMKNVLSSQYLPLHASTETLGRAYYATEIYVQGLATVKSQLRKLAGTGELLGNSERSRDADDSSTDTGISSVSSHYSDELSEFLAQSEIWLGRAELLQSLLGSGIVASLDDISDKESAARLRDRLIEDERYSMAIYTCKKCKIDAFPVWNSWGHALIRMEHYAQARVKFKQALQLYKGDPGPVVLEIINTVEGGPPADVAAVRSMYEHLAKSAPTILDDSLSADAYLNVLYMPSTFPRSERSRRFQEAANYKAMLSGSGLGFDDGPRSNLDNVRYIECIHYLQEAWPLY
ncbi:uncharacterized protein LOC120254523 isoform X2 [Dioscorea cayenensis subsp. rotundata]|uniref:Uncharacterized protein LOC120254523 isoform X2 n=1 Tax=Dioscorea cayennensis subsp. rotundata TaxID=55577 RepID=A0AB40AUN3_DIOCR|nr:uncharacterized protein LOC120254523 isoform X2 [Dioscorea cayenensis subsp. rotundata]